MVAVLILGFGKTPNLIGVVICSILIFSVVKKI